MKSKFKITTLFCFIVANVFADTKTASVTGAWSNTATWGGAAAPVSGGGDDIVVNTGITVTMDAAYSTTGSLTLNGTGTIQMAGYALTAGSLTAAGAAVINNGGAAATLTVGSANTSTTYTGTINNSINLVKNGTAALTLSGSSSYTGTTTISAGIIYIGASVAVSTNSPVGNATSAIVLGDANTTTNNSTPQLLLNGAYTFARPITISSQATSGWYYIGGNTDNNATFSGLITYSHDFSIEQVATTGGRALTISGGITTGAAGTIICYFGNTGDLNVTTTAISDGVGTTKIGKSGTGTTTFSVASTYTGQTFVTAGTLKAGVATSAFGSNSWIWLGDVAGVTLDITGYSNTIGSLSEGGTTGGNVTLGAATLTIGGDNSWRSYAGVISGTGAIVKTGSGGLTLSGANTYSGGTTLSAGQLNLNNATAIGTGTFTIENGTTIDNSTGGSITLSTNNAMTWNGDFTFTGTNALNLGTGAVAMGASLRTITTTASTLTVGGTISGTGGLTKSGNGTMALGSVSASNWTGTTTVNAGTLQLGSPSADNYKSTSWIINSGGTVLYTAVNPVVNTAAFTINSGGTLNMNGYGDSFSTIDGAGSVSLGAAQLILTLGSSTTFSGVISGSGNLDLEGTGGGVLTLSGLNTYTGWTRVRASSLSINTIGSVSGGASALGNPSSAANGTIQLGYTTTTGTLFYTGTAQTTNRVINLNGTTGGATVDQSGTGALVFSSALTATGVGSKTLTLQGSTAGTGTLSGAIVDGSGTTALTKQGSGTWTLSGANTYTGTTTISAGTLQLGAAARISNSSNVVMSGGYFSTGSGAGYAETVGTLTLTAHSRIVLGTGSHSLNFAASNGTTWTAATLLRITGWQGSWNSTTGTSGKIYTGSSAELSAGKLAQIFFTHPISGMPYTAIQLGTGEVVPTSTLPVKLVSFTGEKGKNFNKLFWITASEITSEYFEVLRSADGINFESIGKVNAAGNSNDLLSYSFVDYQQPSGTSYYQLKQFDYDGQNETFNIVAIANTSSEFKMNALFPNPANASITVNFQASESGSHFIFINDAQGNEIFKAAIATLQGDNKFILPTQNYASGTYFVRIVNPKKETITSQIVVQH